MKAAIFDMDGVLVDSHPAHLRAWIRLLESAGKPIGNNDMGFILEGRKREEILRHYLGPLTDAEMRSHGQQKELFFREEATRISTIPGVQQFLDNLIAASVPMAVASCGGRERVNYLLEHLALSGYFQAVVSGDDVTKGKPDPSIFQLAAKQCGVAPEEAMCFEDSVSGVTAAVAAGMKCVGIADSAREALLLDAGAEIVVPDFVDLPVARLQNLFATT
jgi:HAD superfamily hydrolase (TIGR01509 family)